MLIATAGHIDHGKTTLVRALTGVETDRLPEERARGISIDLGFATWRPDGGETIGFVDVPGHERYIRNMLAGVCGADFALLVVAADDGVMPQTREHFRILALLGIAEGLVAITKCDRADAGRIAQVRSGIAELLEGSALSAMPVFEVSAGPATSGIAQLAAALIAARDRRPPQTPDDRGFRLAIDRAFTVTGAGTVVTGTVLAGQCGTGADLVLSPRGRAVRVRGLQSGGMATDRIAAGQRCAINLSGIEIGEVHRGDWLVEPGLHAPTSRIEVRLRVLEAQDAALRHGSGVHLHIGAACIGVRVLVPRQRPVLPGEEAVAALALDAPISAVHGERFVLRDPSRRALIGGGTVLDPLVGARRRSPEHRRAMADALSLGDPVSAFGALAAIAGYEPDTRWFARSRNLSPDALEGVLSQCDLVSFGKHAAVARDRFGRLQTSLLGAIAAFHAEKPAHGGMTRRELRLALGEPISADLLAALLRELSEARLVSADGALVRLPGHAPSFSAVEAGFWRSTCAALEDRAPRAIVIADLARELHASEPAISAMLQRRRNNGDVWEVTATRYMLREHVAALAASAALLDQQSGEGFTAAQFRNATGIGRNFVILLLEFFDRIGVTRRIGEVRRMRADFATVTGTAEPWRVS